LAKTDRWLLTLVLSRSPVEASSGLNV